MKDAHVGALLVGAGRGARMRRGETGHEKHAPQPKQFQDLAGHKLIFHSLRAISSSPLVDHVVVVVPAGWESRMRDLCAEEQLRMERVHIVAGGATRQESVQRGLASLPPCGHVIVHDAARPFVTPLQMERVLVAARQHGAATIALPVTDTLMRMREMPDGTAEVECVDRQGVWSVQTPQAFERQLLERAHAHADARRAQATDDGSLVLALGHRLEIVAGHWWNIKVTSPDDLLRARWILEAGFAEQSRAGVPTGDAEMPEGVPKGGAC